MNRAAPEDQAATPEQFRQTRSFRRHRDVTPLTPEQLKRQSDVLTCAWRHFGEAASVIAFLNTPNDQVEGRPLHVALESAEGLVRVEKLLQKS